MLVKDLHIRIVHAATGELLRDLSLDPTRNYQPTGRPSGPTSRTPANGAHDDHLNASVQEAAFGTRPANRRNASWNLQLHDVSSGRIRCDHVLQETLIARVGRCAWPWSSASLTPPL
jgi:hypothetical protein